MEVSVKVLSIKKILTRRVTDLDHHEVLRAIRSGQVVGELEDQYLAVLESFDKDPAPSRRGKDLKDLGQ